MKHDPSPKITLELIQLLVVKRLFIKIQKI